MKRYFSTLLVSAVTAATASAQCYEFAGSGATLQIDITSFTLTNAPGPSSAGGGYVSSYYFESNNTFTVGGKTMTSQSSNPSNCVQCLIGSLAFNYSPGAVTAFTMTVPALTTPSQDSWGVVLGATSDVIPSGKMPQPGSFPTISNWNLAVENNIVVDSGPMGLTMTEYPITSVGPCTGGGPTPSISGVVSASAFGGFSAVAPGSWVEIYGSHLAPDTRGWAGSDFNGNAAPTLLDGVSVSIGGQAAFVDYISPGQVNAQLPSSISAGTLPITLTNNGVTSAPLNLTVEEVEPGLLAPASFKLSGNQYVVAQHSDGSFVLPTLAIPGIPSSPAEPGETIIIYGVGFGPVMPTIPAGEIVTQKNQLVLPVDILFGSTTAQLSYYGLTPNLVGLYQFNVVVPSVSASSLVPVSFTLNNVLGTQTLFTAVE